MSQTACFKDSYKTYRSDKNGSGWYLKEPKVIRTLAATSGRVATQELQDSLQEVVETLEGTLRTDAEAEVLDYLSEAISDIELDEEF